MHELPNLENKQNPAEVTKIQQAVLKIENMMALAAVDGGTAAAELNRIAREIQSGVLTPEAGLTEAGRIMESRPNRE